MFLEKYLGENFIPRGLRINLSPTFDEDVNFVTAWENILDACSFDLLQLLINKRNTLKDLVSEEISLLLIDLQPYNNHSNFHSKNSKTLSETKVKELELIHRKKNELLRDRDDKIKGVYRPWARKIISHKQAAPNLSLEKQKHTGYKNIHYKNIHSKPNQNFTQEASVSHSERTSVSHPEQTPKRTPKRKDSGYQSRYFTNTKNQVISNKNFNRPRNYNISYKPPNSYKQNIKQSNGHTITLSAATLLTPNPKIKRPAPLPLMQTPIRSGPMSLSTTPTLSPFCQKINQIQAQYQLSSISPSTLQQQSIESPVEDLIINTSFLGPYISSPPNT